jgi:hypothetical protein
MTSAEQRWSEHRDRLLADLGTDENVIVNIPGWEPVGLSEGLRWLQATHYEAFKVRHEITRFENRTTVKFDVWED